MPGVPTHGPDCETGTSPADRPTCDSGVFSDAPGPIHQDAGDADSDSDASLDCRDNAPLSVDDGSVVAEAPDLGGSIVRPGDAAASAPDALSDVAADATADVAADAPSDAESTRGRRRRRNRRPRRPRTDPIVAVPPDLSATREFTGTLNEIIPIINLTALGYADDGPMAAALAKAMLGRRWADRFGRITVYTRQPGAEQQESYTALIPAGLISDRRSVKRGIAVAVKLTGIDVSDRRRDWYCDDFRVVE